MSAESSEMAASKGVSLLSASSSWFTSAPALSF